MSALEKIRASQLRPTTFKSQSGWHLNMFVLKCCTSVHTSIMFLTHNGLHYELFLTINGLEKRLLLNCIDWSGSHRIIWYSPDQCVWSNLLTQTLNRSHYKYKYAVKYCLINHQICIRLAPLQKSTPRFLGHKWPLAELNMKTNSSGSKFINHNYYQNIIQWLKKFYL